MKPRRKGAKSQPTARHPSQRPPMEALLAERGIVRATLAGIPQRDRDDVEQEVFLGAWRAVKRGLYRPDPKAKPRDALRVWLHGIAWRQAAKYFDAAYTRRVVLDPQPLSRLRGIVGPDLHTEVEARQVLEALADLKPWQVPLCQRRVRQAPPGNLW
ncbi:RNA polymerase sigma factor [Sorangium sp. So ce854]|uniref:RNA polymerase sigma factor n=1 Tax=Sorangium sp. So ce854 TaxID=3133322 RepID=UPI003F625489